MRLRQARQRSAFYMQRVVLVGNEGLAGELVSIAHLAADAGGAGKGALAGFGRMM